MTAKKSTVDLKAYAGGAMTTAVFGVLGAAYKQIAPANWMNATQFSVLLIAFTSVLICVLNTQKNEGESMLKRYARGIISWMIVFATLYMGANSSVDQKPENLLGATEIISTEGNVP